MAADDLEALLVDDRPALRRALELLMREGGFRVAGSGGAEQAGRLLRQRRHDVALVSATLGGEPATALLSELVAERPGAPLLVYAARSTPAETLRELDRIGVRGLVDVACTPEALWDAARTISAGGSVADAEVTRRLAQAPGRAPRTGIAVLSPREREILLLLAGGSSGAEIAQTLYLSAETVRTHVRNAVRKLSARTRTQAVAIVVAAAGLTPVGTERTGPIG